MTWQDEATEAARAYNDTGDSLIVMTITSDDGRYFAFVRLPVPDADESVQALQGAVARAIADYEKTQG